MQLLQRFHEPSEGSIALDGHDISHYQMASYRKQIGVVSQSIELFSDTVRHNIAFGLLADSTDEAIDQACQRAHANIFINELPEGLDTLLGDDGTGLSGGQRQRLAIARAFLKDAPVLILDEATSALDTESEAQVQLALDAVTEQRTTLVIAHRLSTIEKADRVVVLDEGRIVAEGHHRELLEQNGLYAKLYRQGLGDLH